MLNADMKDSNGHDQYIESDPSAIQDGTADVRLLRAFKLFSKTLSCLAMLAGLLALAGYLWGIPDFISVRIGLAGMSPLTALALCALAFSNLTSETSPRLAWAGSGIAIIVSTSALCSHVISGSDVLSPALVHGLLPEHPGVIGLTSVATAACVVLIALAQGTRLRGNDNTSELLAATAIVIAGLGSLGYAYGVQDLYSLYLFNTMAIHTAAALIFLAVAVLLKQSRGWMAIVVSRRHPGAVTRRQLLLTASLPLIGWMLISAVDRGLIGPAVAIALVIVLMFLPLVILIIRDGIVLTRLDDEQLAKQCLERTLRASLEAELVGKRSELEAESMQRKNAEDSMYRAHRLEAIGQLTGGIAHDFNNLLMAISGNLEFIQRKLPHDSNVLKNVTRAAQATERGIKLTAQLLSFSRTQRLDVQPTELRGVIQTAQDLLGNALGHKIEVQVSHPEEAIWVSTDPLQLELAILNLALNARDAMPDGGIFSVSMGLVSAPQSPVPMASIRVSDTGTGMSPETVVKAGEPFFTTKEHGKGTGLGLAQVYGLCRQCGGDLQIASELGAGTTIEIRLPLAKPVYAAGDTATVPQIIDQTALPHLPVLVVDDDEDVRSVLTEFLRSGGYTVHEASNGTSALQLLLDGRYAAAVIDFLMPGMNGADLARRAREIQPGIALIFVSGYSDTLALDEIYDAVVIRKPFELERLQEALSEVALRKKTVNDPATNWCGKPS